MEFLCHVNSECQITFIKQTERKKRCNYNIFFSTIPGIHQRWNISVTNREESYEA